MKTEYCLPSQVEDDIAMMVSLTCFSLLASLRHYNQGQCQALRNTIVTRRLICFPFDHRWCDNGVQKFFVHTIALIKAVLGMLRRSIGP